MTRQDTRLGVVLMISATLVFATQDAVSRHLAAEYNTLMVVMVRYWFFAAIVIAIAARQAGGVRKAAATRQPLLQIARGLLLAGEVCLMVVSFVLLGLAATHSVFAAYTLLVAALSGPILGERVGWRRWTAIAVGFVGILIILQPGSGALQPAALIPLAAAAGFALYSVLTRLAARQDSTAVSFFWTGTTGAVAMTVVGVWYWEPMAPRDWGWMGLLCCLGMLGHWLLIKTYEVAETSAVQPLFYLQLVWVMALGVLLFDEVLEPHLLIGAGVVVAAGVFTLIRSRQVSQSPAQTPPQRPQ